MKKTIMMLNTGKAKKSSRDGQCKKYIKYMKHVADFADEKYRQ